MAKPRTKVFVAIPTMGTVADAIPYLLRKMEKEYADSIEFIYPEHCVQRRFHDFARNKLVDEFLASKADVLWFLDSDVVPPASLLDLVTVHGDKWEIAGAPYPVFIKIDGYEGPQVVICVYQKDAKGLHAAKIPYSGTDFVDGLATGCLFIKREVFKDLKKPYFEFKYDSEDMQIKEGEDLGFCLKVNSLGYKFFVDYGLVCRHYKTIDLLDANNYAVNYAQTAVQSYDAQIRPQIEALVARLTEKAPKKSGLVLPDYLK